MLNNEQSQEVGAGAIAIQSTGSVSITNVGLSFLEVKEIALTVFENNFYKLAGKAKETAMNRAEDVTEKFVKKLQVENPSGISKSEDPDFQHALFTVQQNYARSGDNDLGDLLIDLLVDRSKHDQRDILQIVLNESLSTAPKLTDFHLAILAACFLFKYTQNSGIISHEKFGDYLDKRLLPFIKKFKKNESAFQHLEFTGCGSIGMGESSLPDILFASYSGLFIKGFDKAEIDNRNISTNVFETFFTPCLNDVNKFQINVLSKENLETKMKVAVIDANEQVKLLELFELNKMNSEEIKNKTILIRAYMQDFFDFWQESSIKNFTLTSVGIAIGHANIKRLSGEFADLSIWIY